MAEEQKKEQELTKEAKEEAIARHRAFEVGIAQLCKEAGFTYNVLAKAAGQTAETLSEALLNEIQTALKEQPKQE